MSWNRAAVVFLAIAVAGCATYRDDLDRAANHYKNNEPERALVLLEVLEIDIDSLSPAERAQYAYYRGMSYLRLKQRRDARHWLGRADAREKQNKGALSTEENTRVADALKDLNEERYGGAAKADEPPEKKCEADNECSEGQFCDSGQCAKQADAKGDDKKKKSCKSDTDCAGSELCESGSCVAP